VLVAIKTGIWIAALMPLGWLGCLGSVDQLGPDPGKALVDALGLWALRLLLLTLSLRPLRDLTGLSAFMRVRRLVGLFCWFYATLHFGAAIFYVIGYSWDDLVRAFGDKTYIVLGLAAWLLLLSLAATSNRWSQLRLKRRWVYLHRFIYVAVIFACAHFLWLVRSDYWESVLYALGGLFLLMWRAQKISVW